MKNLATVIIIFSGFLAACGGSGKSKMDGGKGIDVSPDKLSVKIDPVCQMRMDQHPVTDTVTYKGMLYGFCSSGCKEAFVADPASFLASLPE